nr:MAG TPA: hypothetical protein [Caudoviricetes sp.]
MVSATALLSTNYTHLFLAWKREWNLVIHWLTISLTHLWLRKENGF